LNKARVACHTMLAFAGDYSTISMSPDLMDGVT
jgi:hypothetical protein